jgi:DNA-binding NarL/FixJ family response regulator
MGKSPHLSAGASAFLTYERLFDQRSHGIGLARSRPDGMTGQAAPTRPPVLIVDDDEGIRLLISQIFQEAGFTTVEARTGPEGVQLARRVIPGLAIIDVNLPGMCGYEVLRALREEFGEALPTIIVSGERTTSFDRVGGLMLGADDYVVKPFAADELLERARRLLRRTFPTPRRLASELTRRELEVLRLLAFGKSQDEIAVHLHISPNTVGAHIEHILLKLGVQSRAQAVAVAYRDNIVEVELART